MHLSIIFPAIRVNLRNYKLYFSKYTECYNDDQKYIYDVYASLNVNFINQQSLRSKYISTALLNISYKVKPF